MAQSSSEVMLEADPFALSASTLIGTKVQDRQGEDIGRIEELMIDPRRGCVAFAVLSCGGVLGFGDRLFAIPLQALTIDAKRQRILLDVNRETLENAPGFEKERRSDDDTWLREVYIYYGHTPYWEHV